MITNTVMDTDAAVAALLCLGSTGSQSQYQGGDTGQSDFLVQAVHKDSKVHSSVKTDTVQP
ncbi:hypothetical protein D554_1735 [Bordetella holmesii 30539]|uniref:N-acetyltransferase YedL n=1 Tax=Bordetella holmesii 1058 TaxID=1247648 RepID=A0ABN0RUY2_9BORD|nr:hypothetical protein D554_1735 [Bordetella holmesii 30539]EXX92997.1 hypothetical protein D559_0384 [Bordetella holmesii 1058]